MSLQQYDFDIVYKAGSTNCNADTLSRICFNNANVISFDSELSEETISWGATEQSCITRTEKILNGKNITVKRNNKLATF